MYLTHNGPVFITTANTIIKMNFNHFVKLQGANIPAIAAGTIIHLN
jgi:hypothetical protein